MYGLNFSFSGTISADGMTVNGTLHRQEGGLQNWSVVFRRNPSNLNQFRGSWSAIGFDTFDGDWCGAYGGAGKPSPCK